MKRITHLGLALAGSLSLPALAQTDAPSTTRAVTDTPTAAAETIEEVVVTAPAS